jgi:hypothetical protein
LAAPSFGCRCWSGLIGFTARAAVPMNQILSLITLVTALIVRWHTGSLVGVGTFAVAVVALGLGGVTAAWFAARLLSQSRITDLNARSRFC